VLLILDRWLYSGEVRVRYEVASPVERRSSLVETRLDHHPDIHEGNTSKHPRVYKQVIF
jgi:hypothetical protein